MGNSSKQQAAYSPSRGRRKKKGRPSLIDIQKRTLRLQRQQEEEQLLQQQQKSRRHQNSLRGKSDSPGPSTSQPRRSSRRNPNPNPSPSASPPHSESDPAAAEDDEEEEDRKRSGRETKLRLVHRLPDSVPGSSSGSKHRRLDSDLGEKAGYDALKATDGPKQESEDSRPTTPLPDKSLLIFVLDRLQKKDTYGVFSEPVDPEELPDYFDIIKHPMDFSTIRKKVERGAYSNLEQFEEDVFLVSSNAMCYNSPDTIYYRQARTIQELAKKDFENLRQESDSSEEEPKPRRGNDEEPKPRRGRPPAKNKQKGRKTPADRENYSTTSNSAPAPATGNSGSATHPENSLLRKVPFNPGTLFVSKPFGLQTHNNNSWVADHKHERTDDFYGLGRGLASKFIKKPPNMEESRRNTYFHCQPPSFVHELPVSDTFNGEKRLLVPVGLHIQQVYSRSLARYAAKLGPSGWRVAAKRIERVVPSGTKFGRGWVGEAEAPLNSSPSTSAPDTSVTADTSAAGAANATAMNPEKCGHLGENGVNPPKAYFQQNGPTTGLAAGLQVRKFVNSDSTQPPPPEHPDPILRNHHLYNAPARQVSPAESTDKLSTASGSAGIGLSFATRHGPDLGGGGGSTDPKKHQQQGPPPDLALQL